MTGVLNRSFTRREKVMVVVLLVALIGGLYFLVVHYPIASRMEQIEHDEEEADGLISAAEAKYAEYVSMKQELDEILSRPAEDISVMPEYNNIETLMCKLHEIFDGTNPDFGFGQASINEDTASRTINFTCTARNYEEARQLLRDVTGTGYRCILNSFTMTPDNGSLYDSELKLSGVVTFYEHVTQSEEDVTVNTEAVTEGAESES